jgi:hypothetical protein
MKCLPPKKLALFGYWTKNLNNKNPTLSYMEKEGGVG